MNIAEVKVKDGLINIEKKITVITPTYNRAHLIGPAINSILGQSYKEWEYIIVDDSSTDETESVVKSFQDDRLRYIKLENNLGNAGARNAGIRAAKGEYIVFLDSDDELEKNSLEAFNNTLNSHPGLDYAFGAYKVIDEKENSIRKLKWIPRPGVSFLEELKIGIGCGLLIKKSCFDVVGFFDENLRVAVDTDWLIRLDKEFKYEIIDAYLVKVHAHEGLRVRHNKVELLKSYQTIYLKNKDVIDANSKLRDRFYYKIQWLNYHQQKNKQGNEFFMKLIKKKNYSKKAIASFLIFNLLPFSFAKKLHLKVSEQKFLKT